jgi:uncharacterized protein involved in exopolysaccharide biosynthesis
MNPYRQRESELSFAMVIDFLVKFRKPIIIVTVVAGILAAVFSAPTFIHPKFESTVILYPATTNSLSKAILDYVPGGAKSDFLAFGEEEEAEQLLQILQSDYITAAIIKKYDLMKHYGINPEGNYPWTSLVQKFNDNVKYRRTEYSSIEIAVMDEDKVMAANIANDIAALADSAKNNVQQQRAKEALAIVEAKYHEKITFINQLVDSLQKIGELGIYNVQEQANTISTEYARALMSGNQKVIAEMEKQREVLGKYGPVHKTLSDRVEYETEELSKLRTKFEQVRADADQSLPASFIINKAVPAEKKAYPLRSLIVLISMASAFAGSLLLLGLIENYRQYKKRKLIEDITATASVAAAEHSRVEA